MRKRKLGLALIFIGLIAARCFAPPLLKEVSFSKVFYDDQNNILRLTLSKDEKYRIFVPLKEIPKSVIDSFLLKEDKYFYFHAGFNPVGLTKSFVKSQLKRGRRSGASTITMQLVRLQRGLYTRNLSGKLKQVWYAVLMELSHSKNEILEAYLNLIPFGANIEGIGASAEIYFKRSPKNLTLSETLALNTLPQNPAISMKEVERRRAKLFKNWLKAHPDDKNKQLEFDLPIQFYSLKNLNFIAPHFTSSLLQRNPFIEKYKTTLNTGHQKLVEEQITNYIREKNKIGVNNAAAILIDNRDMAIKAMVGSADFLNDKIEGQVNGVLAKRSPGSALKPFIYGLAIEQGLIQPESLLKDAPQSFGNFDPENFDLDFKGPLSVTDALNLSRNIPAVYLASKTNPSLYKFLNSAKTNLPKSEEYYGLAIALGGTEISALDLAKLYSTIFHRGVVKEPRWLKAEPTQEQNQKLISAESFFLVKEILEKSPRPDEGFDRSWLRKQFPIAWKTGTSFGFRDAWTVGLFGPYTLVVWIGNFNNEPNPSFIGREVAAPLFFRIADNIGLSFPNEFNMDATPPKILNVKKVQVCAVSGDLPSEHCKHKKSTWYIPGKSPIKICNLHREILVDKVTGLRACDFDPIRTKRVTAEFWPTDLLKLFEIKGLARKTPPPFLPSCNLVNQAKSGNPPEITSPKTENTYAIQHLNKNKNKIALTANAEGDTQKLYWFANEEFIGAANASESLLWELRQGNFVLRVIDDKGRSDTIDLKVSVAQ